MVLRGTEGKQGAPRSKGQVQGMGSGGSLKPHTAAGGGLGGGVSQLLWIEIPGSNLGFNLGCNLVLGFQRLWKSLE